MKPKISFPLFSAFVLALLALPLFSQAPLLSISKPIEMSRTLHNGRSYHYWLVPVTNNYHAAVTAYVLEFTDHPPGRGVLDFRDSIPMPDPLMASLGPLATATVQRTARGPVPPSVVDKAVIYSDGATAGDAKMIAHLLLARALYLAAIPPTIARLSAIAADPEADRGAVLAHFRRQQSIAADLLKRDGLPGNGSDARVSGLVALNVRARPSDNLQQIAADLVRVLQQWRIKLETSKPKLATIPYPDSGS